MVGEVSWRAQEAARVLNDVAEGDLSQKMALEYEGRPLQGDALKIGTAVNQLVDRLRMVRSEVTRVAREVGTEGQARRAGRGAGRVAARGRTSPTT